MNNIYNFHSRSYLAKYRYKAIFFKLAGCLANDKIYLIRPLYLHYLRKTGNMDMLIDLIHLNMGKNQ